MTDTYVIGGLKATVLKDPDAVLDYTWDWSAYLTDISDGIISYEVIVEAPLVVVSHFQPTPEKITAFISGGEADNTYVATCRIVTDGGRTDDRTIYLKIVER